MWSQACVECKRQEELPEWRKNYRSALTFDALGLGEFAMKFLQHGVAPTALVSDKDDDLVSSERYVYIHSSA